MQLVVTHFKFLTRKKPVCLNTTYHHRSVEMSDIV